MLRLDPRFAQRAASRPAPYTWTNTTEEIDILESVFRYQFEHNMLGAGALARFDHVFLALGPETAYVDPPTELLARFEGHSPPIEPVSAAGGPGLRRDVDLEKAEKALEQRVRAEVSEQYASRLEKAGRWKKFVLRRRMEWEIRRRLAERLFGAHSRQ